MEREKIAQEEFRLKREKEEAAQKRKEEEEVRIFWTTFIYIIARKVQLLTLNP